MSEETPKMIRVVLEMSEEELEDLRTDETDDVGLIRDFGTVVRDPNSSSSC